MSGGEWAIRVKGPLSNEDGDQRALVVLAYPDNAPVSFEVDGVQVWAAEGYETEKLETKRRLALCPCRSVFDR